MIATLAAMLLIIASPAQPTPIPPEAEMFRHMVPPGHYIGYQLGDRQLQLKELVERPETVDNWTRLITDQIFFGQADQAGERFTRGWLGRLREACPAMTSATIKGTVDGLPALRLDVQCPRHPQTGKPEIITAVAIQGRANLMLMEITLRRQPTADDLALVGQLTSTLMVCDTRASAACAARSATGFVAATH
jgi:hypothetical protein